MRLLLLAIVLGLSGCASQPEEFPSHWAPAVSDRHPSCHAPAGLISNIGDINTTDYSAPTLSSVLYQDQLEGYAIEYISFEVDDMNRLVITPYAEGYALEEVLVLEPETKDCSSERWVISHDVDYVDGYTATASVLWTGGALLPVAGWQKFYLNVAEDGSLLLNLKDRMLVDFFYVFPWRFTDEYWLRYPRAEDGVLVFTPPISVGEVE